MTKTAQVSELKAETRRRIGDITWTRLKGLWTNAFGVVLAVVISIGGAAPSSADPAPNPEIAAETVAQLQRHWIFGWDRREGDGYFSFAEKFGDTYDFTSDDVILYDSFDPQRRVAHTATEYGSFFEKSFNDDITVAEHAIEEAPSVVVSGDLAAARFVFIARLTAPDGVVTAIRATTSQVWRYSTDSRWRIVREHTSVDHIPLADADEAMRTLPRS